MRNTFFFAIFAPKTKKTIIILFFLLAGLEIMSAKLLRIVSYNVENLFHPAHDSVYLPAEGRWMETDDLEWTPDGERRWTYSRYHQKVHNIAKVLTIIGQWDGVDMVGLCEVENAEVVRQLCHTMRYKAYDFVHYESPDRRGIDVALIYKTERIDTLCTRAIPVNLGAQSTRDILYVSALVDKSDTLHLLVCHLPSQRGGAAESEWKRRAAQEVLQHTIDSIYATAPNARIIVMGDMNGERLRITGDGLRGVSYREPEKGAQVRGTHKYQGMWSCLDQFYTSPALDAISHARIYAGEILLEEDNKYMGFKPKRTYIGYRYQNGYSDHLPVILDIEQDRREGK